MWQGTKNDGNVQCADLARQVAFLGRYQDGVKACAVEVAYQLYEAALERLTREVAAVNGVEEGKAQASVDEVLGGRVAA